MCAFVEARRRVVKHAAKLVRCSIREPAAMKSFEDLKSESNIYILRLKTVKTFKIKKMISVFFLGVPYPQNPRIDHRTSCIESGLVHGFGSWQVHGLSAKR